MVDPVGRDRGRALVEERAAKRFQEVYRKPPTHTAWAPGRVNLLGDHTDTSEGFVLPLTLRLGTAVALGPSPGGRVRLHSLDLESPWEGTWEMPVPSSGWERYPLGVASSLGKEGIDLPGCDVVIATDLPVGQGLGSSAALEVALTRGLSALLGLGLDDVRIATICQRGESEFSGVRCGIMDPFCSSVGRCGQAIFLDTRTLGYEIISLPAGCRVVVLPTGVVRELATSAYNQRRLETESAVRLLGLKALRDLAPEGLERSLGRLPSPERERARHVVTENARVLAGVEALRRGEPAAFGRLMGASHASLRDDYEVSSAELEALTEVCKRVPGCWGARLTGAGFGGSVVALVEEERAEEWGEEVGRTYQLQTGLPSRPHLA